jgi:hypothetical protein
MKHPSRLGCKSCQKALANFDRLCISGAMTHEKALAAYTFGTGCRAHNDAACASAVMLTDDAYAWLYAQVSMA